VSFDFPPRLNLLVQMTVSREFFPPLFCAFFLSTQPPSVLGSILFCVSRCSRALTFGPHWCPLTLIHVLASSFYNQPYSIFNRVFFFFTWAVRKVLTGLGQCFSFCPSFPSPSDLSPFLILDCTTPLTHMRAVFLEPCQPFSPFYFLGYPSFLQCP